MKNFPNYLITFACLFAIPFVTNAQRNKQNNTTQEETIIWHTGTYPFTEKKITKSQQKEKLDSMVYNSDYIIEGSLGRNILTFADEKGIVWGVFKLGIFKKIKGDIKEDTIYYMFPTPLLYYDPNDRNRDYFKQVNPIPDYLFLTNGIFFMKKSEMPVEQIKPDTTISKYNLYSYYDKSFSARENMSLLYEPTDLFQRGIDRNCYGEDYYEGPYKMRLGRTKYDVYDYLEIQYNLEIPGYSKTIGKKALLDSHINDSSINDINLKQNNIETEQEVQFKTWINGGRQAK